MQDQEERTIAALEPTDAEPEPLNDEPPPPPNAERRLVSMDAYRGFVMLLMASEGLGIPEVAKRFPSSRAWQLLNYQFSHVQWIGCGLWDMIQPSFSFLVGVALPYSYAARKSRGQSYGRMFAHALGRSLTLILLGIFLRSMHSTQTNFTFEDTLTQIGLGYPFLFLLARYPARVQAMVCGFILVGYWMLFATYPLPAAGFDFAGVGVPADWPHLQGFAAHWDKNTNFAAAFDQWFLNVLPRPKLFVFNGGGYLTLSFLPTLGTMILGLLAGGMLRSGPQPAATKFRILVVAGIAMLAVGWAIGSVGLCPVVKRIWTPSWTIFSGGWCCLFMAAFYGIIEIKQKVKWSFPLVVVGMNSIAMYLIAHIFYKLIRESYRIHLGQNIWEHIGGIYAPILEASAILFGMWLITYWMYRRKLFLRI